MVNGLREIRLDLLTTPFNLNYTLTCGQTFRWEKHDDCWHGVARETLVKIRQIGGVLQFQTYPENVGDTFIQSYFRLDDDLLHIYSRIEKDRHIRRAVKKFRGLRHKRQTVWVVLICYIIGH